jgi:hypothetical protein
MVADFAIRPITVDEVQQGLPILQQVLARNLSQPGRGGGQQKKRSPGKQHRNSPQYCSNFAESYMSNECVLNCRSNVPEQILIIL